MTFSSSGAANLSLMKEIIIHTTNNESEPTRPLFKIELAGSSGARNFREIIKIELKSEKTNNLFDFTHNIELMINREK